jgi:hypothetical protein
MGESTQGVAAQDQNAISGAAPLRLLSKADIMGVSDLKFETLHVPEWGGSVRVRTLRSAERDEYEQSMVRQKGKDVTVNMQNIRAGLVARALCDENGDRLFSDAEIALLGQKSAAALERVFDVAARLSSVTPDAIEVLGKNSASDRSGAPSSG